MNRYLVTRGISYVGFWSNRGVEVHVHNITSAMCFLCHYTSRGVRTFGMRLCSRCAGDGRRKNVVGARGEGNEGRG